MGWIRRPITAAICAVALLTLGACSGADEEPTHEPSSVVEVEAEQPAEPSSPDPEPETVETVSPSPPETPEPEASPTPLETDGAGARAQIADRVESLSEASCLEIEGAWIFHGAEPDVVTAAVRTVTGNPDEVDSASVIFADGLAVQVTPGKGSASIEHDGERFVVTGSGQRIDVSDQPEATFLITAECA